VIFHSVDYLVFLVVVLALYWALGRVAQNVMVLAASYFFYGYIHPWFLIPLLVTTVVDYFCAIGIEEYPARKKIIAGVSFAFSLGLLGFFKYAGFFVENVTGVLSAAGLPVSRTVLEVVLPVGISFYTFQSIGYIVDVFRGHVKACRNPLSYALYTCFFPQLVAGPIERASRLISQIEKPRRFDPERAQSAFLLILWGVFKKLAIADNVAITANKVFALRDPDFALLWVGVLAFGVQIFADFSAYTDIARGSARLLGFELMENFRNPYLARSPGDFWRRWHISLSTWLRDYVYIPLGGSRGGPRRTVINLLLTFFISGLWHGAQWNFILWGFYWGVLVVLFRSMKDSAEPLWKGRAMMRIAMTFALTHFGWLLFRETDLRYLGQYLTLSPLAVTVDQWQVALYLLLLTMVYALPIWLHAIWTESGWVLRLPEMGGVAVRASAAAVLTLGILVLRSTTSTDFIYFQF
jgi:D-alanyl-lipoteichoic acid acyltransferase DltB (MBOAT superfamily)